MTSGPETRFLDSFRSKPLFYAAFAFAAGIFAQTLFFAIPPFIIFAFVASLTLAITLKKPPLGRVVLAMMAVAALGAFEFSWTGRIPAGDVSLRPKEQPLILGGIIDSPVERSRTAYGAERASFTLRSQKVWTGDEDKGSRVRGRVKVYVNEPSLKFDYGDEWVLEGELAAPQGQRNPGGFNFKSYLERKGVRTLFFVKERAKIKPLRKQRGHPVLSAAYRLKEVLSGALTRHFEPAEAAFLKALFLGERGDLEEDFKELFIKTGTMHILAVSGFNIGFLAVSLLFLLRPLALHRNVTLVLTLMAIWLYCLLVGWQSPVIRATVMATVFAAAQLLGRRANALNSLGLAALALLALNPRELFDVGFQLSFLAVYGILLFLPVFFKAPRLLPHERLTLPEKAGRYASELFWISFVSVVVTLPVTVQNFYIVTPLSFVANMVVVPLAFLIFFAGILFFLSFWWTPAFLAVVPLAIKYLIKLFMAALWAVEHLPGSSVIVGKLQPGFWALLVAGSAYFLVSGRFARSRTRAAAIVCFLSLIFLAQDVARGFDAKLRVTVLDVGQGDAIYVSFPDRRNLLIDGGDGGDRDKGRFVVAPFLKSQGVRVIDTVAFSHPQKDHIGGLPTVLEEFRVKDVAHAGSVYDSSFFKGLKEKIRAAGLKPRVFSRGMVLDGFGDASVRVLNPAPGHADAKNVNNESLVLKLQYKDTSFLFTGDVEEEAMTDMLAAGIDLHSTVLKVPHHGSKVRPHGELFFKAVAPRFSVISVGERNIFGHPTAHTLQVLNALPDNQTFRTDRHGAVTFVSDGSTLTAESFLSDSNA